jgi:hypothetical protein
MRETGVKRNEFWVVLISPCKSGVIEDNNISLQSGKYRVLTLSAIGNEKLPELSVNFQSLSFMAF